MLDRPRPVLPWQPADLDDPLLLQSPGSNILENETNVTIGLCIGRLTQVIGLGAATSDGDA